jgi:hypothetical protein
MFSFLFRRRVCFCSNYRRPILSLKVPHLRSFSSCLMLLGFLFARPVPLPRQGSYQWEDGDDFQEPTLSPAFQHHNHSQTPLLNNNSIKNRYVRSDIATNGEDSNSVGGVMEASRSFGQMHSTPLNVHGRALLSDSDFWLLFSISSMGMFKFPFSSFFNI